ncbi:hypothetical protein Taro_029406 [Colocasia esculenta]|uniref:Uncharacterized protein n=1 Tax=Colocasia esculenta TaxID=4460 RepID=A0A843VJR4_COLES|nr:hypothetical protein [Colocasia esculenta]
MVRNGDPWNCSRIRVFACEGDGPGCRDVVATARSVALGFLLRRIGGSRSDGVPGGASALVTLMERIAHEVGISYVCGTVEVCVVFQDTLTPEFELYVQLRER